MFEIVGLKFYPQVPMKKSMCAVYFQMKHGVEIMHQLGQVFRILNHIISNTYHFVLVQHCPANCQIPQRRVKFMHDLLGQMDGENSLPIYL